jgi:SAM-dependent methyltransferase
MPPGWAAGLVDRVRAGLARMHRGMAPPPVRVLEGVLGLLDLGALGALCALDIPDRLEGPTTAADLARSVDADPAMVQRVLTYAGARGWLRVDRRGRVSPTRTTAFLRRDHPGGWRAWVEFAAGPEVVAAVGRLAVEPRAADAFAAANGAPFFDWCLDHPDRHAAFDAAMAAGGRLHGLALAAALDWSGSSRVCDVGGGTGALLGCLLDREPHLQGVLVDLPAVVDRAPDRPRLEVVGTDAFVGLPEGCDSYLLVNVLHDWDDERAVTLLRNVERARAPGGRAVVVEGERRLLPLDSITARADLLMLALTAGGRERTTQEFARLAGEAGLRLERTIRLPTGDRAHVLC